MTKDVDSIYAKAFALCQRFDDEFVELAALLRQLKETDPSAFKTVIRRAILTP